MQGSLRASVNILVGRGGAGRGGIMHFEESSKKVHKTFIPEDHTNFLTYGFSSVPRLKEKNMTHILDELVKGYDMRLRPSFGGKYLSLLWI